MKYKPNRKSAKTFLSSQVEQLLITIVGSSFFLILSSIAKKLGIDLLQNQIFD
jgi:hypothetical protein